MGLPDIIEIRTFGAGPRSEDGWKWSVCGCECIYARTAMGDFEANVTSKEPGYAARTGGLTTHEEARAWCEWQAVRFESAIALKAR